MAPRLEKAHSHPAISPRRRARYFEAHRDWFVQAAPIASQHSTLSIDPPVSTQFLVFLYALFLLCFLVLQCLPLSSRPEQSSCLGSLFPSILVTMQSIAGTFVLLVGERRIAFTSSLFPLFFFPFITFWQYGCCSVVVGSAATLESMVGQRASRQPRCGSAKPRAPPMTTAAGPSSASAARAIGLGG
ncbi:hypothetical protein DFH27DRAFT_566521 [Peziza echinospora]|nr:hypothetical protein DFH27DRAFT_566521 [Peziza echinospora]